LIFLYIAGAEPQLLKIIDTDTRLYQPLLRNNILIINDDDSVLLLDAFTGALLRNEKLESCLFTLPISENTAPIMQVQKPRELKRKILCPTSKGWTQAEIEVDYSVLGRRTWHEN
jgi:hypothetical protein